MIKKNYLSQLIRDFTHLFLGILFLVLMAFKKLPLPFVDIQMSLQSLSISLLVIVLERKAFRIIIVYLTLATIGLHVLSDATSNPFWFTSDSAGYYIGFLISSYLLPKLLNNIKPEGFCMSWLCLSFNETIILLSGFIVLSFYIGVNKAFWIGVLPYLFGALLKISVATCCYVFKNYQLIKPKQVSI